MLKIINNLNESQHSGDTSSRLAKWFSADPLVQVPVDPSAHTWSLCRRGKIKVRFLSKSEMFEGAEIMEICLRGDT